MNAAESTEYLLAHVEEKHAALLDWRAMDPERRAVLHYHTPHDNLDHGHHGVSYEPFPREVELGDPGARVIVCRRPRR